MRQKLKQISHNPADIGLTSFNTTTRFGRMHYVAPAKRQHTEVMLFVHGFGANWSIWTPLIKNIQSKNLLNNMDFVLIDLPSFGKSENILDHLNSAEVGEELLKLCHQLGYSKLNVTGHSMGGFLTMDLAARHSEIQSIYIIAGTYFRLIRIASNPLKNIFKYPKLSFYYFFQTAVSHSRLLTYLSNKFYRFLLGKNQKPVYELGGSSFLYASRNGVSYDSKKIWGSIKQPVRAVYGSADRLVSKGDMEELKSILPNTGTQVVNGAGHSLLVTHPAEVAKALY